MSDSMSIEPEAQGVAPSFAPPITPPVPGNPGADKYLQSDGAGTVGWAPKPTPGPSIPAGTGYLKQGPPGTISNISPIPVGDYVPPGAAIVPYSPSTPANWPVIPTQAAQALDVLAAEITSIAGSMNPLLPRVWFVDGGVASSGSGSIGAPYKTIGAALSAASAGDLIWVAPGTYVENLVLPSIDNLTIQGSGKNSTIIKAATGSTTPTIKWAPTTGTYTKLAIRDLTIANVENGVTGTGAEPGQCLYLDGNGTAILVSGDQVAQFLTSALVIDNVILDKGSSTGDGYYFRAVDKMYVSDGNGSTILGNPAGWNCSGQWLNVGYALISATSLGNGSTAFTYTYDYTIGVPKATGGRQGFNLLNGSSLYGAVTLTKCPLFGAAPDTAFYGDLVATALSISTAPMRAPAIRIAGQIGTPGAPAAITVTMPAVSAAAAAGGAIPYVDLSDAVVWGSATKTVTMQGTAGGAVRFAPVAHRARFEQLPEGSATVKVYAGTATDFDIRSSYYKQSALGQVAATDGTIDRDHHSFTSVASPSSQTIAPPYPSGVSLTPYPTPTTAVAVGATVTSTTLTLLGTATVNAQVRRNA
jgi:hypothetical protein